MTAVTFVLVALAGGAGSAVRLAVDTAVAARWSRGIPLGTVVVNVSGSFLIGLVAGLAAASLVSGELVAVLATGLLGGYTTFSAASVEIARLVLAGRGWSAAAYGVGLLASAALAASLGLGLVALVVGVR
ncbi:CrcB family protein [Labedella phragmitis]|uniref:Fluoride-specific ion channel FluC n=1 Tax=Labedella phragmitis TaxID=2498849 RepID=A0A3S3Z707_9MICO|nr:CrcB family protein [Labedella phragmitis]RWZ53173.1 CrcB family protein [Labedella phragmitis]